MEIENFRIKKEAADDELENISMRQNPSRCIGLKEENINTFNDNILYNEKCVCVSSFEVREKKRDNGYFSKHKNISFGENNIKIENRILENNKKVGNKNLFYNSYLFYSFYLTKFDFLMHN